MSKEDFRQYGGSTPELSVNGLKTFGRLVEIYDGDTVKVVLNAFGSYYKFTIRLNGIDTCEMKSKDKVLQEYGVKARDRLFEILTDKRVITKNDIKTILDTDVYLVWVECCAKDKYGRVLANIYKNKDDNKSVSDILLDEKLAYKYEGKTKLTDEGIKDYLGLATTGNP
uniref:TNase-like domain-containing protein n=1 Tax=viral metagenome TaxID=1070528 RepID=A0A6C0LF39_9ZZZZ